MCVLLSDPDPLGARAMQDAVSSCAWHLKQCVRAGASTSESLDGAQEEDAFWSAAMPNLPSLLALSRESLALAAVSRPWKCLLMAVFNHPLELNHLYLNHAALFLETSELSSAF